MHVLYKNYFVYKPAKPWNIVLIQSDKLYLFNTNDTEVRERLVYCSLQLSTSVNRMKTELTVSTSDMSHSSQTYDQGDSTSYYTMTACHRTDNLSQHNNGVTQPPTSARRKMSTNQ